MGQQGIRDVGQRYAGTGLFRRQFAGQFLDVFIGPFPGRTVAQRKDYGGWIRRGLFVDNLFFDLNHFSVLIQRGFGRCFILECLSKIEVSGTDSGAVKCVDIIRNTSGEGGLLGLN